MAGYKVALTESAYDDLDKITDYLLEVSPTLALKTYERILSSYRQLEQFPLAGLAVNNSALRLEGYRKLITDDYITIYRLVDAVCIIDHVFNGKTEYMSRLQGWL